MLQTKTMNLNVFSFKRFRSLLSFFFQASSIFLQQNRLNLIVLVIMPAVLGRMLMPTMRRLDFCIIRVANASGTVQLKPSVKQLTYSNEQGHFRYERDRSRDPSKLSSNNLTLNF